MGVLVLGLRDDPVLRRESDMMAFYLGVTLLVVLYLPSETAPPPTAELLLAVWGTTLGLALLHWFGLAFAVYLVRDPPLHHSPAQIFAAQVSLAAILGLVASVALLLTPPSSQLLAARLAVAVAIGVLVTVEASVGGRRRRGLSVGLIAMVLLVGMASLKRLIT